jgi:hypothetical protein
MTQQDPNQELQTELTLSDIKVITQMFDACASKGLFHPSDFNNLGEIYKKLLNIVKQAAA